MPGGVGGGKLQSSPLSRFNKLTGRGATTDIRGLGTVTYEELLELQMTRVGDSGPQFTPERLLEIRQRDRYSLKDHAARVMAIHPELAKDVKIVLRAITGAGRS